MRPLSKATFVLAACAATPLAAQAWTDLGSGKAGTNGVPALDGTAPRIGKWVRIGLTSARAGSVGYLVLGTQRIDLPVFGGRLVPSADFLVPWTTDSTGSASILFTIPNDPRLLGIRAHAQALVDDPQATFRVAMSNAIRSALCDERQVVETFANDLSLDKAASAGSWGSGRVNFAPVGGSGRHGVFDPTDGRVVSTSPAIYEWSTDDQAIKSDANGQAARVTDGRFEFASLHVPAGVEVRFVGSNPARIWVRGSAQIDGVLAADGQSLADLAVTTQSYVTPERGGKGGAFGGDGGDGGTGHNGITGTAAQRYALGLGKNGLPVRLLAGHAYATWYGGSFGSGSPQFPATGDINSLLYQASNVICVQVSPGGGGGGFTLAGGDGSMTWTNPANAAAYAASTPTVKTPGGAGRTFPSNFPPYTNGFTHQDHFLTGGAGGGGAGACPAGSISSSTKGYYSGRAGAGGGGALGMRVGGSLLLETSGRIQCVGGNAGRWQGSFDLNSLRGAGGGGSGGALLLQVNLGVANKGLISVKGGLGGFRRGVSSLIAGLSCVGGDGSDGILHFETAQDPTSYPTGQTVPATPPKAKLDAAEADAVVTLRSLWYAADLAVPPTFLRYEIDALVDNNPVVYSDDPAVGIPASGAASPLRFVAQGAVLQRDSAGRLAPAPHTTPTQFTPNVGPFGTGTSLFGSAANGYRFELTLDRSLNKTVVVRKVTVVYCL